jgi:hypothetical protein
MNSPTPPIKVHKHVAERLHVMLTLAGVPYEGERTVCTGCHRILDERPVRRAAA